MNSIGDEAVRNELLMRLKNISLGAGSSGGGVADFGGKNMNPFVLYRKYKKAIKDGRIPPTITYANFKSKVNSGSDKPKRKTRGKNVSCPVSAKTMINPKTGRTVKTTTPAGLRAYKASHPEIWRLQPNNRYVCIKSYKTRKTAPVIPYKPSKYMSKARPENYNTYEVPDRDYDYAEPDTNIYTDDPTGTGLKKKRRCNRVSTKSLMALLKSRGGSVYE
jgi:hypothetical protein